MLGSTRLLTDQNGVTQARFDYFPFGEEILPGTTGWRASVLCGNASCYGQSGVLNEEFTGQQHDWESGQDYFYARYFNRAEGRFTSADVPMLDQYPSDPESWNLYAYVRNNPLIYVDLTGHGDDGCTWNPNTNTVNCSFVPVAGDPGDIYGDRGRQ